MKESGKIGTTSKPITTSKCSCSYIIFFIAFLIAIVTDFLLPLSMDYEQDYYGKNNSDLFNKEKSEIDNVVTGILIIILSSVICCPYTIIAIYTTMRKRYIRRFFE